MLMMLFVCLAIAILARQQYMLDLAQEESKKRAIQSARRADAKRKAEEKRVAEENRIKQQRVELEKREKRIKESEKKKAQALIAPGHAFRPSEKSRTARSA